LYNYYSAIPYQWLATQLTDKATRSTYAKAIYRLVAYVAWK